MTNEIINDVAMETADQAIEPTEEITGLEPCEVNNVPAAIAGLVTTCIIIPAVSAFALAFSAVAGAHKAEDYFSDEKVAERKAKKEERQAKRLARKEARAAKKQQKSAKSNDDAVVKEIEVEVE